MNRPNRRAQEFWQTYAAMRVWANLPRHVIANPNHCEDIIYAAFGLRFMPT